MDLRQAQKRLLLAMVNEAILCLQEDILATPSDGDVGAVLGLGFPPFLGGPFRYADSLGNGTLRQQLEQLQEEHGVRFRPADLLEDMAARGQRFYPRPE